MPNSTDGIVSVARQWMEVEVIMFGKIGEMQEENTQRAFFHM